jgi:hypothetical protein
MQKSHGVWRQKFKFVVHDALRISHTHTKLWATAKMKLDEGDAPFGKNCLDTVRRISFYRLIHHLRQPNRHNRWHGVLFCCRHRQIPSACTKSAAELSATEAASASTTTTASSSQGITLPRILFSCTLAAAKTTAVDNNAQSVVA